MTTNTVKIFHYFNVKFILRRQYETGQFGNPEALVLVKELSMSLNSLPWPHVATPSHMLTHYKVVCEAPPTTHAPVLLVACLILVIALVTDWELVTTGFKIR